jgi:hypothetical protein
MTIAANFLLLQGERFTLSPTFQHDTRELRVGSRLPSNVRFDQPAVVTFRMNASNDARLTIHFNPEGGDAGAGTFHEYEVNFAAAGGAENISRSLHFAMSPSQFRELNRIFVRVSGSAGTVELDDLVLWYHVDA